MVYLIIIGDVLVGVPPDFDGLWTRAVGGHGAWCGGRPGPSCCRCPTNAAGPRCPGLPCGSVCCCAAHGAVCAGPSPSRPHAKPALLRRYASRAFVLGAVCLLFLAPLLALRDLSLLGPMSTVSLPLWLPHAARRGRQAKAACGAGGSLLMQLQLAPGWPALPQSPPECGGGHTHSLPKPTSTCLPPSGPPTQAGVAIAGAFAASVVGLAGAAIAKGQAGGQPRHRQGS